MEGITFFVSGSYCCIRDHTSTEWLETVFVSLTGLWFASAASCVNQVNVLLNRGVLLNRLKSKVASLGQMSCVLQALSFFNRLPYVCYKDSSMRTRGSTEDAWNLHTLSFAVCFWLKKVKNQWKQCRIDSPPFSGSSQNCIVRFLSQGRGKELWPFLQ